VRRRPLRVAVLGSTGGWHARRLERALTARGHECGFAPVTRMVGRVEGGLGVRSRGVALDDHDVVLVRGIPRGSLEQVVFRVDVLHALAAAGVRAVNSAYAIERSVDKFLASTLLARAGLPTPRTIACERPADALEAFAELGGDVIVKPLFGSMGFGMVRLDDPDVAQRVFRALELERAVYYLQETLPHAGRDVRALVVGEQVVAAIERSGDGWRTNLARGGGGGGVSTTLVCGGRARPVRLDAEQERLCVPAAAALGADYAGVDLLRAPDGRDYVLEVNGIPGWQGVERATGVDVAAALAEHLETVVG
jgi:RimK family alpha-L-glutamate ligase